MLLASVKSSKPYINRVLNREDAFSNESAYAVTDKALRERLATNLSLPTVIAKLCPSSTSSDRGDLPASPSCFGPSCQFSQESFSLQR